MEAINRFGGMKIVFMVRMGYCFFFLGGGGGVV